MTRCLRWLIVSWLVAATLPAAAQTPAFAAFTVVPPVAYPETSTNVNG